MDPLKLELEMVVNHYVYTENQACSPPPLVLYRSQEKQGHTMCLQSWRAVKDENSTVSQFLPLNFGSLMILNPIIILMLSHLSLSSLQVFLNLRVEI